MINPIALREAVVNAIVHNDYSNGSTPKFEFFQIGQNFIRLVFPYAEAAIEQQESQLERTI